MDRRVGLAIGAAIASVTLGVMIGLVIHTGHTQRAAQPPAPLFGTVGTASADGSDALGSSSTISYPRPASIQSPTAPTSIMSIGAAPPGPATTPPPATGGAAAGTSSAVPMTTVPSTTSTRTAPTTATSVAEGLSCPSLGAAGTDPHGTTFYCQVNPSTQALAWRAVTDGGGCLNQTMTGRDAGGVAYRCTLDSTGHNHWRPAASATTP